MVKLNLNENQESTNPDETNSGIGLSEETEVKNPPKLNINPGDFGDDPNKDDNEIPSSGDTGDPGSFNLGDKIDNERKRHARDSAKNATEAVNSFIILTTNQTIKFKRKKRFFKNDEQLKKAREYERMTTDEIEALTEDKQKQAKDLRDRLTKMRRENEKNKTDDIELSPAERRSIEGPFEQIFMNSNSQFSPGYALLLAIGSLLLTRLPLMLQ